MSEAKQKPNGFVYFVKGGDKVKIGWSQNVMSRLSQLQTAAPERLVLLGTMPGTQADERALQERFAQLHVFGEWFRLDAGLEASIQWMCGRTAARDEARRALTRQAWARALWQCSRGLDAADEFVGEEEAAVLRGLSDHVSWLWDFATAYAETPEYFGPGGYEHYRRMLAQIARLDPTAEPTAAPPAPDADAVLLGADAGGLPA